MLIEISQKQKDKSCVIPFLRFYDGQRFVGLRFWILGSPHCRRWCLMGAPLLTSNGDPIAVSVYG